MSILIKHGTLITSSETFQADILIEGEQISAIGVELVPAAADIETIDASGKLVMPGGVDPHTHFNLPMFGTVSSDDHYTGLKAAAFGGTTTVIDFVPHDFKTLRLNVADWHARADELAAVDFGFHMNITHFDDLVAKEIPFLPEMGITSIKVFTAYNNRLRLQDGEIFRLLRIAKEHGLLTLVHAENGDVIDILVAEALANGHTQPEWHARTRPAWGSVEATLRSASLAAQADAPLYIVHLNTAGEVEMLNYARQQGVQVLGETCPQYLFFTADQLRRSDGSKWVCSPPLRSPVDNTRLWQGLQDGSIQTLATDHCPFFYNGDKPIQYEDQLIAIPGKELGKDDFTKIPNGLPGVGDRLPILWTYGVRAGRISANQFVALTSTNPAKIFGLYPQKGTLAPGSDADLVIWDQEKRLVYGAAMAKHCTDYNLYENWELEGFPEKVFLRGKMIVDGTNWLGHAGMGRYLERTKYSKELVRSL